MGEKIDAGCKGEEKSEGVTCDAGHEWNLDEMQEIVYQETRSLIRENK